jgi:hypothetical protein
MVDNTRWKWRTALCSECGTEFKSSRSDANYCGATCRKAASRRTEQIKRQAEAVRSTLRHMKQLAGRDWDRRQLFKKELESVALLLVELEK